MSLVAGTEYLLVIFNALHHQRSMGLDRANAIPFSEVKAYCDLIGYRLATWELEAIQLMDRAYIGTAAEH